MAERTVAVVGLGNMGAPVAACLRRAGMRVLAFDVRPEITAAVARDHDLEALDELPGVTRAGGIVTVLPTGAEVGETFDRVAGELRPGTVWIDMSSAAPGHTLALGARAAELAVQLVDAPLSGGVRRAWKGDLTVMVGGEDDAVAAALPYLEAVGSSVHRTGPLGSAHAMKALNNAVAAAGLVAAGEALTIATRFGVDPTVFVNVLNASTGRNVATERKLPEHVLPRRFDSGFGLGMMVKDVGIACDLAGRERTKATLLHAVFDVCRDAECALSVGADHTEVVDWLLGEPVAPASTAEGTR